MKLTKKLTSFAAFAVMAASPALAQPTLVGTFEGVTPEGNNAFLFEIVSSSTGSYAIELGFQAATSINNEVSAFEILAPTTTKSANDTTPGLDPNYLAEEDTFYFDDNFVTENPGDNPFAGTETNGFQLEATTLFMSFGTAAGTATSSPFSVVRIVTPDDSIAFSGNIAQDGVNNLVAGEAVVPEPTTAALIGLGGLALLSRKRREA